jgi:FtsZ-interacting cell division protein ZipA
MDAVVLIIIGIVVLAAAALFAVWEARRRRRARLQERFGPEYEREVRARGSESDAAQHLREVADRRDRLDIRPLEPAARDRYTRRWEAVQSEFVDRPGSALDEADRLITDVMHDRGYPVEDFSERAELVAADHPQVVEHYRAAHAARQAHQENSGKSDTEELRQAFVHYRALFDELVHGRQDAPREHERRHQG